jgi:hypothetical protein
MQEYDVALKLLLQGQAKLTIRELTGGAVEKWLDNDVAMPLRMAEWSRGRRQAVFRYVIHSDF